MTENKARVLSHLRQMRVTVATEIGYCLQLPHEDVYAALVSLESDGLALVRITYNGDAVISKEWTAAQAVTEDE